MAADFDPGTGLGPRLREVRSARRLSVRELARRVGCSASLISQIERGVSVPSVGVLYALATELGSSLDYLLFGSGPGVGASAGPGAGAGTAEVAEPRPVAPPPAALVQRGGDRKIIDLASGVRWERLTPQSEAMTDFLEVIYSPGGHSTDERRPLRHDGREYALILSGTLTANIGFESYDLEAGDSIAFDASTPHEYLNKTGEVVRAISVVVHSEPGRA
jgi:transcriptional regulator with XRE-family HTH domain